MIASDGGRARGAGRFPAAPAGPAPQPRRLGRGGLMLRADDPPHQRPPLPLRRDHGARVGVPRHGPRSRKVLRRRRENKADRRRNQGGIGLLEIRECPDEDGKWQRSNEQTPSLVEQGGTWILHRKLKYSTRWGGHSFRRFCKMFLRVPRLLGCTEASKQGELFETSGRPTQYIYIYAVWYMSY